ncbi:ribosome biogenesis GTP-binding protein YihA/YsxC [Thioalkalivibrio sp. AKL17]|uniref:ribosome biogenesis GTP-binding protein YihA/YsxC n=1 Tax=Thioalkalivibrio sp. AKL17 TaxID=1158160 RepID=UPI00037BE533|nr:ribosome biogenesis GTP-binding protein YihA/YsxC [Thioalkalivibrio sp. AKL17]
MQPRFRETAFSRGVSRLDQLPADQGIEIAFAGRSNAGKSSALNGLCGRKALARVGRTPGRTQEINIFTLPPAEEWRLIDLPGYGYAKVSAKQREHWDRLLGGYLRRRQCLAGLVLIMDIRRPLTDLDWQMLEWTGANRRLHCVLTKADKISRQEAERQLHATHARLEEAGIEASLQTFSALKNQGVDDLRGLLAEWLEEETAGEDGDGGAEQGP